MATLRLKQGDSLALQCTAQEEGEALSIAGWSIASEVRAPGGQRVHVFEPVITDAATGQYTLAATPAQTATWPAGGLSMDIRYTTASGHVMTTETVALQIEAAITEGAAP